MTQSSDRLAEKSLLRYIGIIYSSAEIHRGILFPPACLA